MKKISLFFAMFSCVAIIFGQSITTGNNTNERVKLQQAHQTSTRLHSGAKVNSNGIQTGQTVRATSAGQAQVQTANTKSSTVNASGRLQAGSKVSSKSTPATNTEAVSQKQQGKQIVSNQQQLVQLKQAHQNQPIKTGAKINNGTTASPVKK